MTVLVRLVIGIQDKLLSGHLQIEPGLNFKQAENLDKGHQ